MASNMPNLMWAPVGSLHCVEIPQDKLIPFYNACKEGLVPDRESSAKTINDVVVVLLQNETLQSGSLSLELGGNILCISLDYG